MSADHILSLSKQILHDLNEELDDHSFDPQTFCILPFSHLSTTTIGEIRLCCRSENIGNIQDESLAHLWKSEKMNEVRRDLIKGVRRPECQRCWKDEDNGIVSLRKSQNIARGKDYSKNVQDFFKNTTPSLPTLELKLSNRCNLRCMMCSPAASTKWMKTWNSVKSYYTTGYRDFVDRVIEENDLTNSPSLDLFLSNPDFIEEFTKAAVDIQMLDFAGGEPLIDPLHYKILQRMIEHGNPHKTTLRYSTNLTLLQFERLNILDLWSKFKEIHLTISIDGSRNLNAFIRHGTNPDQLETNVKEVKRLDQVTILKGTTTVSALNSLLMDETIEYIFGELGLVWHSSRLTAPDFLDARIWNEKDRMLAIERVKNLNMFDFSSDLSLQQLSQRHVDDYLKWMSSDYQPPPKALSRFHGFCQRQDIEGHLWFQNRLNQRGFSMPEATTLSEVQ